MKKLIWLVLLLPTMFVTVHADVASDAATHTANIARDCGFVGEPARCQRWRMLEHNYNGVVAIEAGGTADIDCGTEYLVGANSVIASCDIEDLGAADGNPNELYRFNYYGAFAIYEVSTTRIITDAAYVYPSSDCTGRKYQADKTLVRSYTTRFTYTPPALYTNLKRKFMPKSSLYTDEAGNSACSTDMTGYADQYWRQSNSGGFTTLSTYQLPWSVVPISDI